MSQPQRSGSRQGGPQGGREGCIGAAPLRQFQLQLPLQGPPLLQPIRKPTGQCAPLHTSVARGPASWPCRGRLVGVQQAAPWQSTRASGHGTASAWRTCWVSGAQARQRTCVHRPCAARKRRSLLACVQAARRTAAGPSRHPHARTITPRTASGSWSAGRAPGQSFLTVQRRGQDKPMLVQCNAEHGMDLEGSSAPGIEFPTEVMRDAVHMLACPLPVPRGCCPVGGVGPCPPADRRMYTRRRRNCHVH